MSEPIISLKQVCKRFGPVLAVDEANFDIERGEFFSLLGPSGCGKTTLLRMLAGFETPTSGEIFIDGQAMSAVPPYERPTNMVFQSYAIFPHLSVAENIAFGLRKQKLGRARTNEIVEDALTLIKMPGYGDRASHQLSGGQRQRVALARAIVCRPKVLLLDEPLGALDKRLREEMQIELRQIQRTVGITFVLVTHDQEEALTLSDRVAVMASGKVLQIDSGARIYEAPNCRQVAEFIGNMNIIPARTAGKSRDGKVKVASERLGTLSVAVSGEPPAKDVAVSLAIRPEKISLHWTRPAKRANLAAGRLQAMSYLGDRSHYFVEIDGLDRAIAVACQNAARDPTVTDPTGRPVWISWAPEAALLLTS